MASDTVEYLKNFKNLLDEGLITQEEFETKKSELLRNFSESRPEKSQIKEEKSFPIASPGDMVLIISGSLFVLFALMALGGIGSLTTLFVDGFDTNSLICIAIAAIGSVELCIGLKSALDARSVRSGDVFVAGTKRFEDKNVL